MDFVSQSKLDFTVTAFNRLRICICSTRNFMVDKACPYLKNHHDTYIGKRLIYDYDVLDKLKILM